MTTIQVGGILLDREARALLGQRPAAGAAYEHVWVASGYAKLGRWREATARIRLADDLLPNFVPVLVESGRLHAHAGEKARSASDFARAVKAQPKNYLVWLSRAEVRAQLGQAADAAADLDKAIDLIRPQTRGVMPQLGILVDLYLRDDVFDQLAERRPNDVQIWLERGRLHTTRREWDKALAIFERADRRHPKNEEVRLARAICQRERGRYEESLAELNKLIALRPEVSIYYAARMVIYARVKKWDQAAADAARVLKLFPGAASSRRQLYEQLFQPNSLFEALVKHDPTNEQHWQERGWWHMRNERPEQGFADLTKVIELKPDRRDYRLDRGDLYAQFGMWKEAARDFDVLFSDGQTNDVWQWYRRAVLLLAVGDLLGYRAHCLRMRKEFGQSTSVEDIVILGHTWALADPSPQDRALVVELVRRRMAASRNHPGHHAWSFYVLGLAYYRTGQYQQAIDLLRKRVTEETQSELNALHYLVLALSHARLHKMDEARRWLASARDVIKAREQERWAGQKRYAPPSIPWYDWWQVTTLEREAAALLGEKEAPKRAAPAGDKRP